MRRYRLVRPLTTMLLLMFAVPAMAGEADVVGAEARQRGDRWTFSVSVRHADTGWDHYADRWDVVAPDGTVLGSRTLLHPHVDEQPFTRSLSAVAIPLLRYVTIRAHDKVHGYGGKELMLALPVSAADSKSPGE